MLRSTRPVAIPVSKREWRQGSLATVECSNHFGHTQQFLSNAKLTLDTLVIHRLLISDGNAWRTEVLAQLDRDPRAHQPLCPRRQQLHQHPHLRVQGREVPQRPPGKCSSVVILFSLFAIVQYSAKR